MNIAFENGFSNNLSVCSLRKVEQINFKPTVTFEINFEKNPIIVILARSLMKKNVSLQASICYRGFLDFQTKVRDSAYEKK